MDHTQFLSDWLTYAADNVKARIPIRVRKMFGFYFIKRFWNAKVTNLHMFRPPSLYKMWKWLSICGNEATIDSHHGSEANNTCPRSLTQRLASWSSPVAPKVWVETEITAAKCQKMGHAEVIQTGVVYFQRYRCLSLSVAQALTEKRVECWH